jgi:hypothetical protein
VIAGGNLFNAGNITGNGTVNLTVAKSFTNNGIVTANTTIIANVGQLLLNNGTICGVPTLVTAGSIINNGQVIGCIVPAAGSGLGGSLAGATNGTASAEQAAAAVQVMQQQTAPLILDKTGSVLYGGPTSMTGGGPRGVIENRTDSQDFVPLGSKDIDGLKPTPPAECVVDCVKGGVKLPDGLQVYRSCEMDQTPEPVPVQAELCHRAT